MGEIKWVFLALALTSVRGNTYMVMQKDTDLFATRTTFANTTVLPWSVSFSIWARLRVRSRVVFASDGNYKFSPYMFQGSTGALSTAGTIFISGGDYGNVTTEEWHNFVTVVDRDLYRLTFYMDGVRIDQIQLTAADLGADQTFGGNGVQEGLVFGHFAMWNEAGYLLRIMPYSALFGFVDEVALWSSVLTEEDVRRVFERGIDPSNAMIKPATLVIHYDFEQFSTEEAASTVVPNVGIGGAKFDAVLGAYPSTAFDNPVTTWAVETDDGCVEYVDVTQPKMVNDAHPRETNRAPIVQAQDLRVVEGGDEFTVYLYADDPDGDWISFFTVTKLPSHGSLYAINSIDPSQRSLVDTVPYTLANHFHFTWQPNGEDTTTLIATATDSRGATSEEGIARFVIVKKDDIPTTSNVNVTIDEDTAVELTVRGFDPDSSFLTLVIDDLPLHGSLLAEEDGSWRRINASYAQYRITGEEPLEQYAVSVHAVSTFWASRPNDEFQYPYWHPFMATGPPSLDEYGDSREAWSPLNRNAPVGVFSGGDDFLTYGPWDARGTFEQDGYSEFIVLDYQVPVYLQNVFVGMPRGMGSVVGIRAWDDLTEEWQPVYEGVADPDHQRHMRLTRQYSVFEPFPRACRTAAFKVSRLRIELDTVTIADWNEIDYVQLVGSITKQTSEIRVLDGAARLRYVPNQDYDGIDTFRYRFCDCGTTRCSQTSSAVITVAAVNDHPVVPNEPIDVASDCDAGKIEAIQLPATDVDTNDTLTFTVTSTSFQGTPFVLHSRNDTENGVVYYKYDPTLAVTVMTASLTYTVRDAAGTGPMIDVLVRIACASTQCSSGTYFEKDEACTACPVGRFASGMASRRECELCPAGTFQPDEGQSLCIDCGLGDFSTSEPGATECTCLPGAYKGNGLCHLCPPGTFSERIDAANCTTCRHGFYPTDDALDDDGAGVTFGARACVPCPRDTYSTEPKTALCAPCPLQRTSEPGSTMCGDCVERTYYDPDAQECVECFQRVTCHAGSTLATLDIEKGFWRENSDSTTIYECPGGKSSCRGGVAKTGDTICGDNFLGRLCTLCESGYFFARISGRCKKCTRASKEVVYAVVTLLTVIVVVLLLFLAAKPEFIVDMEQLREQLAETSTSHSIIPRLRRPSTSMASSSSSSSSGDNLDDRAPPIQRRRRVTDIVRHPPFLVNTEDVKDHEAKLHHAQETVELMQLYVTLSIKWKIVISTFQILVSNSEGFFLEWPPYMNFMMSILSVVNVDIFTLPQFQCFHRITHYDRLLAATTGPLLLIVAAVVVVAMPLNFLAKSGTVPKSSLKFYPPRLHFFIF